jgi:cell division protein FtsQ
MTATETVIAAENSASQDATPEGSTPEGVRENRTRNLTRRIRQHMPRRRALIGWAVVAVAAAGGLAWFLSWQSPVPVRDVVVLGASPESMAAIEAAAALPDGQSIRDVDAAAITARVLELPGINAVELELRRPWTVALVVDERFPFAQVHNDRVFAIVDSSGEMIREARTKSRQLPELTGSPDSRVAALQLLEELPEEIVANVTSVAKEDNGFMTLKLRDGTLIKFGKAESVQRKAELILALRALKPKVINVEVPDRPALEGELRLPRKNRPIERNPLG